MSTNLSRIVLYLCEHNLLFFDSNCQNRLTLPYLKRTFVVVGKDGNLMSQRAYPRMALIQPRLDLTRDYDDDADEGPSLFLTAPGMEELQVKVPPRNSKDPTDEVK